MTSMVAPGEVSSMVSEYGRCGVPGFGLDQDRVCIVSGCCEVVLDDEPVGISGHDDRWV